MKEYGDKIKELNNELESLSGKMRIPKHRRRSEEILIEIKNLTKTWNTKHF